VEKRPCGKSVKRQGIKTYRVKGMKLAGMNGENAGIARACS
jgi:hypothetical protein